MQQFVLVLKKCAGLSSRRFIAFALISTWIFLSAACHPQPDRQHRDITRAIYSWKSTWQPGNFEKQRLDSLHVNDIYLKYFDVDWDPVARQPLPVALIRFKEKPLYHITPVVFITNECLQQTDSSDIKKLAERIALLIVNINKENVISPFEEIQIDCDWSARTRDKYFQLLRNIKMNNGVLPADLLLSCTIRMHQVKYKDNAGIPPVDRGLLMCYNMGNLKNIGSSNSIIDKDEFKKYIGNLSSYPLDLDVALPIFDWKVSFRAGKYHGITEEFPDSLLNLPVFSRSGNRYAVLRDTLLNGYDLRKGDVLRYENSDLQQVTGVAHELSRHLKNTRCKVALYHLDAVLLNKYSLHELESIYNGLR